MSKLTKQRFSELVNAFELTTLFNRLGWDNFQITKEEIKVKEQSYTLSGVAKKKDFCVLECAVEEIPEAAARKQFEKPVSGLYFDHLLVFTNKNKTVQFWQLPLREEGKLKRMVTFTWRKGQDAEWLYQKFRNLVFSLEEEEIVTLFDVKERVNASLAANSETVTKKFYTEFTKQHEAFLAFIKGIDDAIPDKDNFDKKWYASLMMNRLMFCYFIQKKRFLDWNDNYLQDKLNECKKLNGADNFYGFYRSFLMELFHDELANPKEKRKEKKIPVEFGNIPYLNGGLFEAHYLENAYKNISITDEAFQNIFDFFGEWEWHLDTRINATGKDINPDVIGYIFEKYINNRADMGAYYTKEDITDYIGKNTIIPFLLEKVKSYDPALFEPSGGFWQYLRDSGDEYIYDAVKKGGEGKKSIDEVEMPENIAKGIDTKQSHLLERRKDWNTTTPDSVGLPTEIWRETIARLERYFDLKRKIAKGEITEINDLITYNLNIRKLVEDYLEQTADKEFIRKFYKSLMGITVLDPTCGSGAFLFAALNILEPLYETCLQRMEEFHNANPRGNKDFEDHLLPLLNGEHPSNSYYIYKTIILNNLYGVDLMKEAAEIAKLRLFLKLVAEVDPSRRKKNLGLEPLPDIDFNIRQGNTLAGFATEQQLEEVVKESEGPLIYEEKLAELKSACKDASTSFSHFKEMQTAINSDSIVVREVKQNYADSLKALDEKLNRYLADTYGLGAKTQWKSSKEKEQAYQDWKSSHQPFHWFAEFYEIISNGGFDVVIGNPPYIEYNTVKKIYTVKNIECLAAGNLYAYVIERSFALTRKQSRVGMIIQLSAFCTPRMASFQQQWLFHSKQSFLSFFDDRPGKLFDGLEHIRVAICINEMDSIAKSSLFTTNYMKFQTTARDYLFENIAYLENVDFIHGIIPKLNKKIEQLILKKLAKNTQILNDYFVKTSKFNLFFHNAPQYFIRAHNFVPYFWNEQEGEKVSTQNKKLVVTTKKYSEAIVSVLASTIFYWWFVLQSDCRHLNMKEISGFPIALNADDISLNELQKLSISFQNDLQKNSFRKEANYAATGKVIYDEYYPKLSKPIIDEIDKVLAKYYGFTEEELDFIINYDIKYRMGGELDGE